MEDVKPVLAAEYELKKQHRSQAELLPDEYEFYLIKVSNRLSVLLSHCEQLEHTAPLLVMPVLFREGNGMRN